MRERASKDPSSEIRPWKKSLSRWPHLHASDGPPFVIHEVDSRPSIHPHTCCRYYSINRLSEQHQGWKKCPNKPHWRGIRNDRFPLYSNLPRVSNHFSTSFSWKEERERERERERDKPRIVTDSRNVLLPRFMGLSTKWESYRKGYSRAKDSDGDIRDIEALRERERRKNFLGENLCF